MQEINELAQALAKAQGAMKVAAKDSVNPHFKSRYADLASVWEAIRAPLSSNGLAVVQLATATNGVVNIETILMHSSGQQISSALSVASGTTPQQIGSAITYARRYALSAMVGIAPDDDDGNQAQAAPERQSRICETGHFDAQLEKSWRPMIESGKKTVAQIIEQLSAKYDLTEAQKERLTESNQSREAAEDLK